MGETAARNARLGSLLQLKPTPVEEEEMSAVAVEGLEGKAGLGCSCQGSSFSLESA